MIYRTVEELPIPQPPYIKSKGFLPNPVVVNGIPKYADSLADPKVVGTPEYEQYWTEQLYRCVNGYKTGGIFLPGRFYYYMNFNSMATVNGVITPDFCDMHLQLCYAVEFCSNNKLNLIMAKKRRAGISEAFQKMVIDYGYRFVPAFHAGIAAGKKTFADDFIKKWKISESLLVPEFRMNRLTKNEHEINSGYVVNEGGQDVEKGIKTELYIRTAHSDPNVFKGTYLNAVICEEAGEFENFKEFYSATTDCLMDSDIQVGTMYIFGTGGNINKGSKDFKYAWEHPEEFNAVKFCITGDRFKKPFYGGATRKGVVIAKTPNLLKQYKPYQIVGCEDKEAAIEDIIQERDKKKKGELKKYLEYLQNNPLNESEIFRKLFSNKFDVNKINDQMDEIAKIKPKYSKYKLEWIMSDDKTYASPRQVRVIPLKDGEDDSECVCIMDEYHPDKKYQNLYVSGCDPYDQDEAVSNSLGAMCVITRKNTYGIPFHMPIAIIRTRPRRKEMFFDMCVKLSVYYNLVGNSLGDKAGSSGIINWYKQHNCEKYLAKRPTKFESENSEQSHEYWMSINGYSKPLMLGLMQTAIYDYIQNIWFDLLISELASYDEADADSDKDLADAYGIALVQDSSVGTAPRDNSFMDENDPFELNSLKDKKAGRLSLEQDYDEFGG